jgi:hypothetical protein
MKKLERGDFRTQGYMTEVVDDDDGGVQDDGDDENVFPCHYLKNLPPTLQKSTLSHYSEVDEEDQW